MVRAYRHVLRQGLYPRPSVFQLRYPARGFVTNMQDKDLYKLLGVKKEADTGAIKKAFYKKAKQYHPDSGSGNEEKFKEVSNAYEILSDATKRREYDAMRAFGGGNSSAAGGQPGGNPFGSGFYGNPFNQQQYQQRQQQQGQHHYQSSGRKVDFEQAKREFEKMFKGRAPFMNEAMFKEFEKFFKDGRGGPFNFGGGAGGPFKQKFSQKYTDDQGRKMKVKYKIYRNSDFNSSNPYGKGAFYNQHRQNKQQQHQPRQGGVDWKEMMERDQNYKKIVTGIEDLTGRFKDAWGAFWRKK
mmetsp:Transcript_58554/g.66772  ORF Transcript_58554/g.66772 Transcript_58554/m.66772 type:complete len:297 (-) Transcript_58554:101-991(-)